MITIPHVMSFEDWVIMVVFADDSDKWKIKTLKEGIKKMKGIGNETDAEKKL